MNDNWISVEDELPSLDKTILLVYRCCVYTGYLSSVGFDDIKEFFWWIDKISIDVSFDNVTYWQYLPELPLEC